jgi:uncharacterized membrane protein YoaK (UPF0700 family)
MPPTIEPNGRFYQLGAALAVGNFRRYVTGRGLSLIGTFGLGIYLATLIVASDTATDDDNEFARVVWPPRVTHALGVSLLLHPGSSCCGSRPAAATPAVPHSVLLAIWAMAMGMQSVGIRKLDVGGVSTTAPTATFIFFFGDFARRPLTREERHRLCGVLVSLVIGAAAGARLLIDGPTYAPLLPFVITGAVVAIAAKAFAYRDNSDILP